MSVTARAQLGGWGRVRPRCEKRTSLRHASGTPGAIADLAKAELEFYCHRDLYQDDGPFIRSFFVASTMLPSTSTTTSSAPEHAATSGASREPKSSSSSSSRENRPNSDEDEDGDEDEDDVRLTRPHLRFISEAGHDHVRDSDGPLDGHSASASSSARPKTLDDAVVPEEVVARVLPLPFKLSLVMRNTGSVARDHLSAERTFLAYVRTSLSFASAGVGPSLPLQIPHLPLF